jgi:hypothetical protein
MELFCFMKLYFPEYLILGFGDASVHHDGLFVIIWVLGFYRFVQVCRKIFDVQLQDFLLGVCESCGENLLLGCHVELSDCLNLFDGYGSCGVILAASFGRLLRELLNVVHQLVFIIALHVDVLILIPTSDFVWASFLILIFLSLQLLFPFTSQLLLSFSLQFFFFSHLFDLVFKLII